MYYQTERRLVDYDTDRPAPHHVLTTRGNRETEDNFIDHQQLQVPADFYRNFRFQQQDTEPPPMAF
jgi:hypothetical protein